MLQRQRSGFSLYGLQLWADVEKVSRVEEAEPSKVARPLQVGLRSRDSTEHKCAQWSRQGCA